ncbi:unnamed protein product [Blepharisma stoltei]|uniref:Alpha/beta hydrolase fold-3 domain-containing protein n=1 Tax=Blepharisma stoltei TaxID=1481888 RepID=A0AAU9JN05_9CILI|nr:unnamed protein product [Blepharisma stoltei]
MFFKPKNRKTHCLEQLENSNKMELSDEIKQAIHLINRCVESLHLIPPEVAPHSLLGIIPTLLGFKTFFQELRNSETLPEANATSVSLFIGCLSTYLEKVCENSKSWQKAFGKHEKGDLLIFYSKLQTLETLLPHIPNVDKNDLFCLPKTHERWTNLQNYVNLHLYNDKNKVKGHYKKFMLQVSASQAFVSTSFQEKNKMKRKIMLGLGAMYYNVFKKKALRKTQLFYANPSLEVAQTVWNLVDSFIVKHFMKLMIASIKVNKVIYLPRTVSNVTLPMERKVREDKYFTIEKNHGDYVMVRVLCHRKLACFKKSIINRTREGYELPVEFTKLIFHIHGGGFISMSSASHQVYSRKWAKDLQIPVISVDYRLAPQHPFPAGIDDVWQVYNWILDNAKSQLGIDPQQIIVAGDSAGGNFAAALASKAAMAGIKIPDGLMLTYPALSLSLTHFTPSFAISLEDLLVPHTFLKICLNCYLKDPNNDPENDPLISPLFASSEILRQFNQVRIVVGSEDPLHDDCYRYAEKLHDLGVDVKMTDFDGTPHGCLNLIFKGGVKESRDLYAQTVVYMREMFKLD